MSILESKNKAVIIYWALVMGYTQDRDNHEHQILSIKLHSRAPQHWVNDQDTTMNMQVIHQGILVSVSGCLCWF